MAGHSKWAQIKHRKAHVDAKKGKIFTKLVKEISVAARLGGGDPEKNPRLRVAIDKAREVNMPMDNIKRAIMKGTGELAGTSYEEVVYEGYGPGGVALLIEAMTDNKNRTVSDIRHILTKHGGSIGESGCVSWIFDKKGYILIDKKAVDEDTLISLALEAGAEDVKNDPTEDNYEIIMSPEDLNTVKSHIEASGISVSLAEVTMLPKNYVSVEGDVADQMLKLIDALEEHDDVQNVYANFDIPDEAMNKAVA
ncbi:MAG TPA: YebC/PmpR family DNA-binding transcriptional regulator [Thermodesulfovibrio thiophilus]|nr:YebC/PmpR family DNA-binding transcriptional regulator [Thermodesulfovibrio thiophilus]